jgi:beta-glucosidase
LVAGSAADNIGQQAGAWTIEWQGVDGNWLPGATSILQGIQAAADSSIDVVYSSDAQFSLLEQKADVGIAVVGEKPYAEGWGDNANPALSTEDIETINRLKAVSEKVVVVLVTGRPLLITDHVGNWDSLVVVWLPGSEGAGVADVLFGKEEFTGTLPLPWPASISQLPIETDSTTSDGSKVLFERGFGLRN